MLNIIAYSLKTSYTTGSTPKERIPITTRNIHIGPPRLRTAIQAVVWLGKSGGIISSSMIADRVKTHATFVRRIMTSLCKADIIASKGGRDGGYYLEKSPADITLADIYLAVGQDATPKKEKVDFVYPEGEERLDVAGFQSALETLLENAEDQAIAYLKTITVAQLMAMVKMV